VLLAALLCPGPAAAEEWVRVRISRFAGDEPLALSSESHPDLFELHPSIAKAELEAINPQDPTKEDHGPGTWLPVLSAPDGRIELRVEPAPGQPVALGVLHFQAASPVTRAFGFLFLLLGGSRGTPVEYAIVPGPPSAYTVMLDGAASDAPAAFRWDAAGSLGTRPSAPAGFRDLDLVLTAPLCEDAPREECRASARASLSLDGTNHPFTVPSPDSVTWSWKAESGGPAPRRPDAEPLFAFCLYDQRGLVLQATIGPQACGTRSCWKDGRNGFRYRSPRTLDGHLTDLALGGAQRASGRLRARFEFSPASIGPLPLHDGAGVRSQLVRSDDGECFESLFEPPARKSTDLRFEDRLR
jgi:hypothetical protein